MVEPICPPNNDTNTAPEGDVVPVDDGPITSEWCQQLARSLLVATWAGARACRAALPPAALMRIYRQASDILKAEPTLLEVIIAPIVRQHAASAAAAGGVRDRPSLHAATASVQCLLLRCCCAPQINPSELGGGPVLVVGDTHGQYHDVLRL